MVMPFHKVNVLTGIKSCKVIEDAEEYANLVMHLVGNVMLNADSFRIDGGMRMQ